jgi:hypothetical protein
LAAKAEYKNRCKSNKRCFIDELSDIQDAFRKNRIVNVKIWDAIAPAASDKSPVRDILPAWTRATCGQGARRAV